jgi:hypothetical protein
MMSIGTTLCPLYTLAAHAACLPFNPCIYESYVTNWQTYALISKEQTPRWQACFSPTHLLMMILDWDSKPISNIPSTAQWNWVHSGIWAGGAVV